MIAALLTTPSWALDQVSLQLKWKHQFQFAGYYAALEQGFYRDAGLDVEIREGGPDVDVAKALAAGQVDFGVCSSSVLLDASLGVGANGAKFNMRALATSRNRMTVSACH